MKKKMVVLRSLLIVFILSISLLGCGKKDAEVADVPEVESETESVQEEPTVEEEATVEEQPTEEVETEETTEADTQEPTTMVDWETFAAQADNDDICLVISNEKMSIQTVLFEDSDSVSTCFYQYMEEDKVAVPIRDNIQRVCYYVAEADGTQKGDIKDVYWKDDINNNLPYVEIEIDNEAQYYISIFDDANNKYTFGLYK